MIVKILRKLSQFIRFDELKGMVGVITPYRRQVKLIKQGVQDKLGGSWKKIVEVNTVDGFQGREKDIIIISCVRARQDEGIGFVAKANRLNVAITRAIYSLIIVGSASKLEQHKHWRDVIEHARKNSVLISDKK
eukprot:c13083_g1_i2.p1 GENE.c13083_g1_i2~~c13083_g1_i2.p1  ORF type:complete len:134 (+),score=44.57 c13083_g1_i2:56-457(+)